MADESVSLANLTEKMGELETSESNEAAELAKIVQELKAQNTDNSPALDALAVRVGNVAAALDAASSDAQANDPNTLPAA